MHVVFRENAGLDEMDVAQDLGQTPADLVVLSFSDSDLGAFADAWHHGGGPSGRLPTLRLANLSALKHPLSIDTYIEQTLSGAKGVLVRLIGGAAYWQYGLRCLQDLARREGIALAVLPADGRCDTQLEAYSNVPKATSRRLSLLCDIGGRDAAHAALAQIALASGLYAGPAPKVSKLPMVGGWTPDHGVTCPVADFEPQLPLILITFYRSYLVSADLEPISALFRAFEDRGYQCLGLFAPSLKAADARAWLERHIRSLRPTAIVNATAFSGRAGDGTSPLDSAAVPVFQVALATSNRKSWEDSNRGLSPTDLAMHVVLPEVDGRIFLGVISFKEKDVIDPDLQFSRQAHCPDPERIEAAASRVHGWLSLAMKSRQERRIALILSTYPGKDWQMGHAVGLDAIESAREISRDLQHAGYDFKIRDVENLTEFQEVWPLAEYLGALKKMPETLICDLKEMWGSPENDPNFRNGSFSFNILSSGKGFFALQPERGNIDARGDDYHDLARVPCHGYVAFYLWLQGHVDAVVHIGAHGTLEWLPGKSVALSDKCWPDVLVGTLPVIYPFIVNDPGEAAQAKRRIGAVTLGHVPPPMQNATGQPKLARLEGLLDEFSIADGLDPKRRSRLQDDIRAEASAQGVEADLGINTAICSSEALARIDRFVCDIKESQFSKGLHVWGVPEDNTLFDLKHAANAEKRALIDALDGKRIESGPSGSPYRGRLDVLPTGRNMFTTDPRSVPTRAAYAQGEILASELIRRHLQDQGDLPQGLVIDLWGSATMRTAGEEFSMALSLLGVKPIWDEGSERVKGIEVCPIAELEFPRIDVTLRISGLFRDVFPTLTALFALAVRKLAQRDESKDWNPYIECADLARVYGPEPGQFGLNMGSSVEDYSDTGREQAAQAWLNASSWVFDRDRAEKDLAGIKSRMRAADTFVHVQDLPETDLLLAADYATHEAGYVAAKNLLGGRSVSYHLDATRPERVQARQLQEEIARVVRARASSPDWIDGMKAHGFRGAAEIAATLDHMAAFAHLADAVNAHLFDLFYDATLGDDTVIAFLKDANPIAFQSMIDRFNALRNSGIWRSRRNAITAELETMT